MRRLYEDTDLGRTHNTGLVGVEAEIVVMGL